MTQVNKRRKNTQNRNGCAIICSFNSTNFAHSIGITDTVHLCFFSLNLPRFQFQWPCEWWPMTATQTNNQASVWIDCKSFSNWIDAYFNFKFTIRFHVREFFLLFNNHVWIGDKKNGVDSMRKKKLSSVSFYMGRVIIVRRWCFAIIILV